MNGCAMFGIAPPSAFFVQKSSVVNYCTSELMRAVCSSLHALSQPSRLSLLPSSHSSPKSRTPLPHSGDVQTPALQTLGPPAAPQALPSASGVPATQTWASVHTPLPAHASAGVQLRVVSDDRQLNLQFESQPSPSTALPSSHS